MRGVGRRKASDGAVQSMEEASCCTISWTDPGTLIFAEPGSARGTRHEIGDRRAAIVKAEPGGLGNRFHKHVEKFVTDL